MELTSVRYTVLRVLDRAGGMLRRAGLSAVSRAGRGVLERWWGQGISIQVQGIRLSGGVRDRSFLYRLQDGSFEPETIRLMLGVLRPGGVVLDVGAYLGFYSVLASRRVGPDGRVYAFEPERTNFAWLQRNVHINQCPNVVLHRKALSDRMATQTVYRNARDPSRSGLTPRDGWETKAVGEVDTGDHLVDAPAVDVVKIDVEGAETSVLRGMKSLLTRSLNPTLFVEMNPAALKEAGGSPEELLQTLRSMEFRDIEMTDQEVDAHGELQVVNLYCRRVQPVAASGSFDQ